MQLGLPFAAAEPTPREIPPPRTFELYYVRHRRARRYVLRVDHDGRVRVTIPRGGSRREADAFAARQAEWIRQQQARCAPAHTPDELRRLKQVARRVLPQRLLELAGRHQLTVTRVSVRNQRSRWGSCGRDGHICLNWRLVLMPEWVRDYVLVHELMHLRRMDHSPTYWNHVAAAFPDFEAARAWLRRHGRDLR
jgi:predicted metal-dependent hydrolase